MVAETVCDRSQDIIMQLICMHVSSYM